MRRCIRLFISLSFLMVNLQTPVFAKNINWVKLRKTKVGFQLPSEWNFYEKMLGMPLVMVSPKIGDGRITVSITNTGLKIKSAIKEQTLKEQQNGWFIKRRKWLSNTNGVMKKAFPYEVKKWKHIEEKIHQIGMEYSFGEDRFVSYSYYFWCNGSIFQAMSLYRLKEFPNGITPVNELFNSLRCGK